uniref:Terpene cyclase/mutase family member n=1 Tax=Naja naja TaxID=35670 RepID=A0A8C6XE24_NAJNA
TVEGRQKWYYVPENEECAREQNALEAYTLGLNTSKFFPELPKASTAQEAVLKAIKFFSGVQAEDGHWPAECSGVLTLAAGLLIACYVSKISLPEEIKKEILRYIRSRQLPEGGWGLEQQPTIFGTALNYIAMRILGYGPDHPDIVRARISLHKKGGALGAPHLGKVWLAIMNVYSWEGMNAPFPELWLLPTWVPGHPSTYWCHARHILLAMTYCQLNRLTAEEDELVRSLRQELYVEDYSSIDWPAQKKYIYEADLQAPHTLLLDVLFALFNLYDTYHLTSLRKKATAEIYEQIKADDIFSNFTNSSPICKPFHMLISWHVDGPNSAAFQEHAGVYNDPEYNTCLKKAHSFLKCSQVRRFPFSNRDNSWIVSDCTAEAMKALMLLEEQCPFIEDHIAPQHLFDGINVLLNMRNSDGGFSSYETRRGSWLLEAVNCAETYADCMVDHTYIECTSSVMQELKLFQKKFPDHRREEIRYDSWISFPCRRWGVCFIYGTWFALEAFACLGYTYHNGLACNEVTRACAWLVSKQMKDGGWGEEFESYKFRKYIQHTISQVHQTAWALLGLMAKGVQVLIDKQQAIGDWPQGDIATGFYKAGTLHYSAYRNIFPIFALGRFTRLYPDSPLAREHLKNGPRHSTEGQTMKH